MTQVISSQGWYCRLPDEKIAWWDRRSGKVSCSPSRRHSDDLVRVTTTESRWQADSLSNLFCVRLDSRMTHSRHWVPELHNKNPVLPLRVEICTENCQQHQLGRLATTLEFGICSISVGC